MEFETNTIPLTPPYKKYTGINITKTCTISIWRNTIQLRWTKSKNKINGEILHFYEIKKILYGQVASSFQLLYIQCNHNQNYSMLFSGCL